MEEKTTYKVWSKEEVRLLKKWWNKRNEEAIAQMLGRTLVAVRLKATKEGLTKSKKVKPTNTGSVQIKIPFKEQKKTNAKAKVQEDTNKGVEVVQGFSLNSKTPVVKEEVPIPNSEAKLLTLAVLMSTLAFLSSLAVLILELI